MPSALINRNWYNIPPVANAGQDQDVYAGIEWVVDVTLDGGACFDEDGDELAYLWSWVIDGATYTASGADPEIELPVGEHVIRLVVNDGSEDSEADEMIVNVIAPIE